MPVQKPYETVHIKREKYNTAHTFLLAAFVLRQRALFVARMRLLSTVVFARVPTLFTTDHRIALLRTKRTELRTRVRHLIARC